MIAAPNLDRNLSIDSLENISYKMNKVYSKIMIRGELIDVSECSLETDLEDTHQATYHQSSINNTMTNS